VAGTTTYLGISYPTATDYVKDGASNMQTIATGFDSAVAIPTYNNQTGTSYTFVLLDAAKVVSANNASAVTFTIPPQSSVAWATGTTLTVTNLGAGTLTLAGGAGVTVTNSGSTISQYGSASIIRTASDAWTLIPFAGGAALLSDGAISGTTGSPTTTTYTESGTTYKTYAFTGSGSITISKAGLVDLMIVGGGGGGFSAYGGGGAASIIRDDSVFLTAATHTITIGAGGGSSTNGNFSSVDLGVNTYLLMALGGATQSNASVYTGGSAAFGFDTTNLGKLGGLGATNAGGGGGGNTTAGSNATSNFGAAGGAGTSNTFRTGASQSYCGGGGGGGYSGGGASGGSGAGAGGTSSGGASATANTGSGGGGCWTGAGGTGGSGLVVIRVKA
jgi:hypothetical protein